jgi:cytochrome c551/c552
MKKNKNLLSLLVAAVLLVGMFAACEGPAGPKGDKGDQGDAYINWEGYKTGIQCAECHNPDIDTTYYVWARKASWAFSKHAVGGAYTENAGRCSYCHTTEGFIQAYLGQPITDHSISSPIGCFACHSPHSRADFSLRTTESVLLTAGVEGETDQTFDYGKGNLCGNCHRPRVVAYGSSNINPKPDPTKTAITDTIVITTSRWYQHYGVQAPMLAGYNGFEFVGYTYSNSTHTGNTVIKEEGCVICHMAEDIETTLGGHSMNLANEAGEELLVGCNTTGCHDGLETLDYNGVQTEIEGLLDSLHTLLLDREWITASGSTNASTSSPLKIAPAYLSGAMYNFYFVEHDLSLGVHNTKYARQLLESSIAELTGE